MRLNGVVKKHGIELLAIHLDADGSTPEEKIEYVTKMFDVAQKLSIPVVAIPAGGKTGDKELTKQEFKYIGKLCERAESRVLHRPGPTPESAVVYNLGELYYSSAFKTMLFALRLALNWTQGIYKAGDDYLEIIL